MSKTPENASLLETVVKRAESRGATTADAVAVDVVEGSVRVRLGDVEELTRSRERQLGLRVFVGQRQAISATSDLRPEALDDFIDRVVAMARLTAEDPHAGLPDPALTGASHVSAAGLADPEAQSFDMERAVAWCKAAETAAMADPRIKNSEGGSFGFSHASRAYCASGGVAGSYSTSNFSGSVVPIAEQNGAMERDYWWTSRRFLNQLDSPEAVGQKALARTLRRLDARRLPTGERPVVFDPLTAGSLLRYLASAINGYSIYRGASFLRGKLGELIASPLVTVVDDATLPGALGSRPYDAEGLASRRTAIVSSGRLETWLMDTYAARKLGLASTGSAVRSVADAPTVGTSNLHLLAGTTDPDALLDGIADGFYVTELIGFGVNVTTGDFSQGAAGLRIKDGKLDHAVNEVTIAGNLLTMLGDVEGVGSDLDTNRTLSAPSLRLRAMMVAGE